MSALVDGLVASTQLPLPQIPNPAVDCFKRNLLPHFVNEQLTRLHRVAGQVGTGLLAGMFRRCAVRLHALLLPLPRGCVPRTAGCLHPAATRPSFWRLPLPR
jgi:hypothetical protein